MKKILENKKLVAGIVAGIVAIAILVLIIVLAGGSNSGNGGSTGSNSSVPGVSDSTTTPNVDPTDTLPDESTGDVTDPTDSTGNTDGTENTDPVEPTDPAEPTDPTEDTEPDVTVPPVTEPKPTEPSFDDDDQLPTGDTNPPIDTSVYDFGDLNPGNITFAEYHSWDKKKQDAFVMYVLDKFGDYFNWDLAWKENYNRSVATEYYSCGMEGHHCLDAIEHQVLMEHIEAGCGICGKHDCASMYGRNNWGGMQYNKELCPEYDEHNDPTKWCPYCGLPKWGTAKVGEEYCSRGWRNDYECDDCGQMVYVNKCHHCIKKP